MKKLFVLGGVLLGMISCEKSKPTEVFVLPGIHANHEVNPNYTYEDLFAAIRKYDPQVIGIEIRAEDMEQDDEYLDPFYPSEMMMARDSFPGKVLGIDFYGEQTRGRLLEVGMFRDTTHEMGRIVELQRRMSKDSLLTKRFEEAGLYAMQQEQIRMAHNYTAEEMINGEYDSLTKEYYILFDNLLKGTEYKEFEIFNTNRDIQITKNALEAVKKNEGKKILFLVGANHRYRLVDSLRARADVKLVEEL